MNKLAPTKAKHGQSQLKGVVMARKTSFQRGSVELKDGFWTLRYRVRIGPGQWQDKREQLKDAETGEPFTAEMDKEASMAAAELMVIVNRRNNQMLHAIPTFRAFVDGSWQHYLDRRKVKESTRDVYSHILNKHLYPKLGDLRLDRITPQTITDLLTSVEASLSKGTQLKIYMLLHTLLEVAAQYDFIAKSPVRPKLHRPQYRPAEKPILSSAEISCLMQQLPFEYKLLVFLTTVLSLRINESLALRWMDVDFELAHLSVVHGLYKRKLSTLKTAGSQQTFHLPTALVDSLRIHRQRQHHTADLDFVFCEADGRPYGDKTIREHVLYPAMDAVGIKRTARQYGWHIFRHSGGSILYEITKDLKLAQKHLRHTQSKTTDGYVHVSEVVAQDATNIVAAELLNALDVSDVSEMIN